MPHNERGEIINQAEPSLPQTSGAGSQNTPPINHGGRNNGSIFIVLGVLIVVIFLLSNLSKPRVTSVNDQSSSYISNNTHVPLLESPSKSNPSKQEIAPTQTIKPTLVPTKHIVPKIGEMVTIPSGNFLMGATENEAKWHQQFCNTYDRCLFEDYTDMLPSHTVFVDSFSIDVHETTNNQYRECVSAGVCSNPDQSAIQEYLPSDYFTNSTYNNFPVVAINWEAANNYCNWKGKRLPTEAEWEKASKGGDNWIFPWVRSTNELSSTYIFPNRIPQSNFCDINCLLTDRSWKDDRVDDGWGGPALVMSYLPNPFGIYDLSGNVQEWVEDYYSADYYENSPTNNPKNTVYSDNRITRGGGWNNGLYHSTSEYRRGSNAVKTKAFIGFRCVMP